MYNKLQESDNNDEHMLIIPDLPDEYFLDSDPYDSLYISQRYILLAIDKIFKGENVSIVIYDNKETKKLFNYYESIFGEIIKEINIIWVPEYYYKTTEFINGENINWSNYLLSHGKDLHFITNKISYSIKKNIYNLIQSNINNLKIRGYKITPGILKLKKLPNIIKKDIDVIISGYMDSKSLVNYYGKSILHEDLEGSMPIDLGDEILSKIPKGITIKESNGKEGIYKAINKLFKEGIYKLLIKPVYASSGEGIIIFDKSNYKELIDNYDFVFGDIIIEEFIDLLNLEDVGIKNYPGEPMSFSVQYYDGKIIGKPSIQLTKDNEFQGNILMSDIDMKNIGMSNNMLEDIVNYSNKLISKFNLEGNGGFDFLIDKTGKFYFVDPNIGRDTGALPIRLFESILNDQENKTTIFTKINGLNIFDLDSLLTSFKLEGLDLINSNSKKGILPISFISGVHLTLIISGDNYEEVDNILGIIKRMIGEKTFGEERKKDRIIKDAGVIKEYNIIHNS